MGGGEAVSNEGLVVGAADGGPANEEFGRVNLGEVADEVRGFGVADAKRVSEGEAEAEIWRSHRTELTIRGDRAVMARGTDRLDQLGLCREGNRAHRDTPTCPPGCATGQWR